ncbi:CapA family protein [Paenibacillus harenae]|uniref:Poly-gamma-glutamate synthesis protein (Capsule biosynthesis protein) n=1 Tax=Paenibacillus harenae TaxID=306543 RepID=A0ABT9TWQ2_PAEHA|nr:CapA family protein [Paenibacillus harenae]MDQ0111800.1 poly-gamma-glutamate synthesis protein (capsule biosynthesis protein) [Paenibacillus harenae]
MNVSRSETRQHEKRKRKRKIRRLMIINVTLLTIIVAVIAVWLIGLNPNKAADSPNSGNDSGQNQPNEPKEPDDASGDSPPNDVGLGKDEDESNMDPVTDNDPPPADDGDGNSGTADEGNEEGEKISLSFVGDVLLAPYVEDVMKKNGFDFPYRESLLYLSEPDLTAANFEYAVTLRDAPAENKQYVYKGPPDPLPAFRDAGFDVVSLANNHTMDHGAEGLLDTMDYLDKAGISHMGAGKNDTEAFAPSIHEVRGVKVAYVGLSRVVPEVSWKADKNTPGVAETYDTTRAVEAIAKANDMADLVVVMVHWGTERTTVLEDYQKQFARQYIDAGADLVIGSHPHVLQGFEMYNGKWIAYSLGNFIFGLNPKGEEKDTGVLDAVCSKSGECDMTFHPMVSVNSQPIPLEGDEAATLLDRLTSISFGVALREDGRLEAQ